MEKVEESVKISDACMSELHGDQEKIEDRLERLGGRVKEHEFRLESLEDSVKLSDGWMEESEDRLELLEEREATLKVQSIELRDHLNTVIGTINKMIQLQNKTLVSPSIDNSPQPTVQQVYDMYQSQPPDEEGWQEMTDAIKAAEEYEARRLLNIIS